MICKVPTATVTASVSESPSSFYWHTVKIEGNNSHEPKLYALSHSQLEDFVHDSQAGDTSNYNYSIFKNSFLVVTLISSGHRPYQLEKILCVFPTLINS